MDPEVQGRAFASWKRPDSVSPEEALDLAIAPWDYTWNATYKPILFRRRDWSVRREWQVPARLVSEWEAVIDRKGYYTLSQLSAMADLNSRQQRMLALYAGPNALRAVQAHGVLLRMFASLTLKQRELSLGDGLDPATLSLRQQALINAIIAAAYPACTDLQHSMHRVFAREADKKGTGRILIQLRNGEKIRAEFDCLAVRNRSRRSGPSSPPDSG